MTDILTKLESLIDGQELGPVESLVIAGAANEIERLRAALHRIAFAMSGVESHWQAFAAHAITADGDSGDA